MPKLNAAKLAQDLGGQITEVLPDGNFRIKIGEKEKTFNLNRMAQEQGLDLSKSPVVYSTPELPIGDTAVGFSTALKLKFAKTAQDKYKILEQEFGKENINLNPQGGITLKGIDGQWKTADTGYLADIYAESPVIAASIAGAIPVAKGGAALGGALAGPLGAAAGGLLGGALGGAAAAAAAKWTQLKSAQMAGVRSEEDLMAWESEVGKEFSQAALWGIGVPVAGKVLGAGAKVAGRAFNAISTKEGLANLATKLNPGTQLQDWITSFRSFEDKTKVLNKMKEVIEHKQIISRTPVGSVDSVTGKVAKSIDPASEEIVEIVDQSMKSFKKMAESQFDEAMNALSPAFKNTKVSITEEFANFQAALASLGLVDDTGKFLTKVQSHQLEKIESVFGAKSRNIMKTTYELLQKGMEKGKNNSLSFEEARSIRRSIDNILEDSGFFKGGDLAVDNGARRLLKTINGKLSSKLGTSLESIPRDQWISYKGQKVDPATLFRSANTRYSAFRDSYDDFALTSRFGGDVNQTINTVNRMIGENGAGLEASFGKMAESVGGNGPAILTKLQQLRAARELSKPYDSQNGIGGVIKGTLFGGPRDQVQSIGNWINKEPVKPQSVLRVKAAAMLTDTLQRLPSRERLNFLSNPQLLRGISDTIYGTDQMFNGVQDNLLGRK